MNMPLAESHLVSEEKSFAIGDPHNFGRRVCLHDANHVYKPRPLIWEWLFLDAASPLRIHVRQLAAEQNQRNPFRLFPDLQFKTAEEDSLLKTGIVDRLVLSEVKDASLTEQVWQGIGATVAIACWFGMADLHYLNMAWGCDHQGRFIFAPFDIECILDLFTLPSQTLLLPSHDLPATKTGLIKARQQMQSATETAALCQGYLRTLQFFKTNEKSVNQVLTELEGFSEWPVRVIIRSTREYVNALNTQTGFSDFLPEESLQMARGDVPYFFRKINSSQILFLKESDRWSHLNPVHELSQKALTNAVIMNGHDIPEKPDELLKKAGALQLARFFDLGRNENVEFEDLKITFQEEKIFLCWQDCLAVQCLRKREG